jgi:hypothetical protein
MGSAFRKALAFSGETWTPPPEPERPRDAGRSVEATRRRRERKANRWLGDDSGSTPTVSHAPTPKPAESAFAEHLLLEAERLLDMRTTEPAFISDVVYRLRVSADAAGAVVAELARQGRIERAVATNGFVTLRRIFKRRKSK